MKKNIDKQFTLEYLFLNQMNIMHWNLSESWKVYKSKVYLFVIVWKSRNIRSLFNIKNKRGHISSVVYEGKCNCGEYYIGEIGQNVSIKWDEYSDTGKNSESAKHLYQFPEHKFNWKILRRVPNKVRQRKIHDAYYIMCLCPTLNNWLELISLTLIRNGVIRAKCIGVPIIFLNIRRKLLLVTTLHSALLLSTCMNFLPAILKQKSINSLKKP